MSRIPNPGKPLAASTMIGGGGRRTSGLPSRAGGIPARKASASMGPKRDVAPITEASTSAIPPKPSKTVVKIPAFSIPVKKKLTNKEVDKLKKKMMRRNKPQGEDTKKLKEIVKGLKGEDVTIEEFIALVAPSTGDDGDVLKNVLFEELSIFRDTARNIYETMTQDITDVLTNEHIQLSNRRKENEQMYRDKMIRTINEIHQYIPNFELKEYLTNVDYIRDSFPHAQRLETMDPEQKEAMLRQEAFHRYQWLKSEGERLKEENTRLQSRFKQLKKDHRNEMEMIAQREDKAVVDREILEQQQEELEDKLEVLNKSIEKTLVEGEKSAALETSAASAQIGKRILPRKTQVPRGRTQSRNIPPPTQSWAAEAATDIETSAAAQDLAVEANKIAQQAKASASKGAIKKFIDARKKMVKQHDESGFHYSPPRSPPRNRQPERSNSPFHYSPPKTPPAQTPQLRHVPEDLQIGVARGGPPSPQRPGTAPRDSWGGYY